MYIYFLLFLLFTGCSLKSTPSFKSYQGLNGETYKNIDWNKKQAVNVQTYKDIDWNKKQAVNVQTYKNIDWNKKQAVNVQAYKDIDWNKEQAVNIKTYKDIDWEDYNGNRFNKTRIEDLNNTVIKERKKTAIIKIINGILHFPNILTEILFMPFNHSIEKKYNNININQEESIYDNININDY